MSLDAWRAILRAHARVEAAIEKVFEGSPQRPDLGLLGRTMQSALTALQRDLVAMNLPADIVILPLVCLYDERVLVRLGRSASAPDAGWTRLQGAAMWAPAEDGGDLFFEDIDHILRREQLSNEPDEVRSLVLETYRFCLQQGFEGRYAGDAARLDAKKKELIQAICALRRLPEPAPDITAPRDAPPATKGGRAADLIARRPVMLAIAAVLVVFGVFFMATRWQ